MFCNQCGKVIPDGSKFCNYCGASQSGTHTPKPKRSGWWVTLLIAGSFIVGSIWMNNESEPEKSSVIETTAPSIVKKVETPIIQTKPKENVLESVPGSWSADYRQLGDGGYCGIYEPHTPVKNCKQITLTLKAEGNYGATTRGNWEVHFRIGGQWKKIQTIYYSGNGAEDFTIYFSPYATFDGVCAFPTQQGNYSYQTALGLSDARCS